MVIRDVLSRVECEATIDEVWRYIETGSFKGESSPVGIRRDDPSTWGDGWPSFFEEKGYVFMISVVLLKEF